MLKNKIILLTGGTGFLSRNLVKYLLNTDIKKIIVFSRSEEKQFFMRKQIEDKEDKIRYIIGDVRDYQRLNEVMQNVDIVIHTAALKNMEITEYNPIETVLTNVIGTANIIKAVCNNYVEKLVYISSDKANSPVNLYGATKFVGEKLVQHGFVYKDHYDVNLVTVRYGNIAGSTGSIIPVFKKKIEQGIKVLPLTSELMSRFWFDVHGAIDLIMLALEKGKSQDIFIPKLKSFYVKDLIKAFDCKYEIVGIRQGEKLSECMINKNEYYKDFGDYYIINPKYDKAGFDYDSANNIFMNVNVLKEEIEKLFK